MYVVVLPNKIQVEASKHKAADLEVEGGTVVLDYYIQKYVLCDQEKSGWQAQLSKFRFRVHHQGPSVLTLPPVSMFCVTKKNLGGKRDSPNSGSGCTLKVPLQDTRYNM